MKHRTVLILLVFALVVPWVSAQVPAGGEFQINTYTTYGQVDASVGSDAAGNFVVAWTSFWLGANIFAQRYDASGAPQGTEFRVNTVTTPPLKAWPAVACDPAGNFVVVWSGGDDEDPSSVSARRYDPSGSPRGTEFRINTYTTDNQWLPAGAADAAGNFVVVWESSRQDLDGGGVFAQRYDASGAPRGIEFQVNTYTTSHQQRPVVASDAAGDFVVVWTSRGQDGSYYGVFAQRYDASGMPRGGEFQVNTYTTGYQRRPAVASDAAGNFVVAWQSTWQDGSGYGIFAQRYDAQGAPRGVEFRVNSHTPFSQTGPSVASDAAGNFVVAWNSSIQDGDYLGVFAQRYDASGAPRGTEFQVNTRTTGYQYAPSVAADAVGNFVVAWTNATTAQGSEDVFGQRYGNLDPVALAVDTAATGSSDGNGVFEPGESVDVKPAYRNLNGLLRTVAFGGNAGFGGPGGEGVLYYLRDADASYGPIANGDTAPCIDCYEVGVSAPVSRPVLHWDTTLAEDLELDPAGQRRTWKLHVGESFADVPKTSPYYRFVETLLHKNVTGGCSASAYCPSNPVTREQMSVFVLAGNEGAGYLPAACWMPPFGDVPTSSLFCRWIRELARRGVVSGCGGGNYCPTSPVTREQMSVFLLRTLDPVLDPPACTTPAFGDVPASSTFCRWIEELARRGITGGCGGGNYCPADAVTREQMAVLLTATFGFTLYGP